MAAVILVTRDNIPWAATMTGLTEEEVLKKVEAAEARGVVCNLPVSSTAPPQNFVFPLDRR